MVYEGNNIEFNIMNGSDTVSITTLSVSNSEEKKPLLGPLRPIYKATEASGPKLVLFFLLITALVVGGYLLYDEDRRWLVSSFDLVSRDVCGANDETVIKQPNQLAGYLVTNVLVTHTNGPSCVTISECCKVVQEMQRTTNDIAYNFLIGGDAQTYEAHGWTAAAFTKMPPTNTTTTAAAAAYTIAFIGDYSQVAPSQAQMDQAHALTAASVNNGRLHREFRVFGVRTMAESRQALMSAVAACWRRHWGSVIVC